MTSFFTGSDSGKAGLNVKKTDNSVDVNGVSEIQLDTNLTLTDNGGGSVTVQSSGGGGGGAVDSVNGKTGTVVLNNTDVGALGSIADVSIEISGGGAAFNLTNEASGAILVCNADISTGSITIDLLNVTTLGFQCVILQVGIGETITITDSGGTRTINGAATKDLTTQYTALTVVLVSHPDTGVQEFVAIG